MNPRTAAWLCFANAAIAGYALHRLGGWVAGEPDPRMVGPSVHTPYFWRMSTALWWGVLAALAGWRFPGIGRVAEKALPWVVGAATIQAFLVP